MENIIYFFGIIFIGYIIYLIYTKYHQNELKEFSKKALLTIILSNTDPLKALFKKWENDKTPKMYYLLSNIISINDWTIKENYYNYCVAFVKQATAEIKKLLLTIDGQVLVKKKIGEYKSYLESELKQKQLIDLKLKENRLKYLDVLKDILGENKKVSEIDFVNLLMDKFKFSKDNAHGLVENLYNRESGLIYCSDQIVKIKAHAGGGIVSELDKNIFRLSHELWVLNEIDLMRI